MSIASKEPPQAITPKLVSTLQLPERSALCLAQTCEYIYAGLPSGVIRVFQARTLRFQRDLTGHTGSVLSLICVHEKHTHWLISASADSTVRIWDARSLKPIWVLYPPSEGLGDILSVTYIDRRIVFGTQSCAIAWVELPQGFVEDDGFRTPPPQARYNKFFDSQPALDLSRAQAQAHGRLYSSLHELTQVTSRSSTSSEQAYETLANDGDTAACMAAEPDDTVVSAHYGYIYALESASLGQRNLLISGSGDGSIKLWTSKKDGFYFHRTILPEQEDAVLSLVVKDNITLLAGLQGGDIRVFDLTTYSMIRQLSCGISDIICLCTSSELFLATTAAGHLQTWNSNFMLESTVAAHNGIALSCTSSNGGSYVYSSGNDGDLKVWQTKGSSARRASTSEALQGRLFGLLAEFVSYKSISSSEAQREACRQTALWCKDALASLGADATLLPGAEGRNPVVFAKFVRREKAIKPRKRVLFYGHYDVVSEVGKWTSGDPFKLTGINGYLYGRGVIDNKGPILAAACAAADLLDTGDLDVDFLMLLEGEEETDSAGLQSAVQRHSDEIGRVDVVLVSNSYSLSEDIPSIMFGLRGRINLTVNVTSENPDLHSGMHGGICHEPLLDLSRLIAGLVNPVNGLVAVSGFYDKIRPLDQSEEEAYDEIIDRCPPGALKTLTQHSHLSDYKDCLIKAWRHPSLSVHKIDVSGSSISTIIPSQAQAKISIRTVPDMPLTATAQLIIEHIQRVFSELSSSNKVQVEVDSNAPWWIADRQHPYSLAAEQAIYDEWKVQPLWIREGGSLPSLPFLEAHFKACTVHLPMGVQGDHAHLVDEKTSILNLQRGKKVVENWLKAIPSVQLQTQQ